MTKILIIVFPILYVLGMFAASVGNTHSLLDNLENTKQPSFFSRHSKVISRIGNLFLLSWIGFWFYLEMLIPVHSLSQLLREGQPVNSSQVCMTLSIWLVGMTVFIGIAGASIGFMSFFQYQITRTKRIVLLIICLLPFALTGANLAIHAKLGLSRSDQWLIIKLGLLFSFVAWLFNGTTIIFGKHFLTFAGIAANKLITKMQKKKPSGP